MTVFWHACDTSPSAGTRNINAALRSGTATTNNRQLKDVIEKKKYQHGIQLLKIELSQRDLLIQNQRIEFSEKIEELQERLAEADYQKQILQTKLDSQIQIEREMSMHQQDEIRQQLQHIMSKQKELEDVNYRLLSKSNEIRKSLQRKILPSDDEYQQLKTLDDEQMTLKDFIMVRFYEIVKPLELQIDDLQRSQTLLDTHLSTSSQDLMQTQRALDDERRSCHALQMQIQKLSSEMNEYKNLSEQYDFKKQNYDRIKNERDNYERHVVELDRQVMQENLQIQTMTREKEGLLKELAENRNEIVILRQDKEYLTRQLNDIQNKYYSAEEKISTLETQVDDVKRAKETLYEKYISARDTYKNEYENKLAVELDQLRSKTSLEIDKLRHSVKEMYERENRGFQHGREEALVERDRIAQTERELQRKYDELLNEHRQYQSQTEIRLADQQSELKMKTFELDRLQLLYEENLKNLKSSQIDIEKLQKKNDLIQKEYFNLQVQSDRRMMEIDTELNEKRTKLQVYEKVEQELDEVVMQAAQVENDGEADKVLFSYGYGATLPTAAKRRLQHSVHLAKRVIQLEQANTSLRLELDKERKKTKDTYQQLQSANTILDQAQQPYDFLIATVRNKDQQLKKSQETIEQLEKQLQENDMQKQSLLKTNNQLTKDIEKLLEYQEPLKVMKNVILNLQDTTNQNYHREHRRTPSPTRLSPVHQNRPRSSAITYSSSFSDIQHSNPAPTVFTSSNNTNARAMFDQSNNNNRVVKTRDNPQGKYRHIYKVTNK
ncbi:unnamed protein product [Didymodactylos carnosus]|uniref:Progesterone-induced-blocking factor 1 n=1 Tax=Didymodactylos carnosus TaxID=1234261 RepID=A0A814ADY0_9BILA|nr:unnamed protein product [Didymodactylos carnosus]CAF3694302.1 unnamed protein product [Didymodactylos carnosus]